MHRFDGVELDSETDFTGAAMADLINFDKMECGNLTLSHPMCVALSTGDGGRGFMKRVCSSVLEATGWGEQIDEEVSNVKAVMEEKIDEGTEKIGTAVEEITGDVPEETKGEVKAVAEKSANNCFKTASDNAKKRISGMNNAFRQKGKVEFKATEAPTVRFHSYHII
jgi:hypothetical protein